MNKNTTRFILQAVVLLSMAGGLALWFHYGVINTTLKLDSTELEVRVLLEDLEIPWDMDWSPDGWIWFSQRNGKISRYSPDAGELQELLVVDEVYQSPDNSGMQALALHPRFPEQPLVYVHYVYSPRFSRLVRFRFDGETALLQDRTVLLDELPANISHNGSRIVFSPDGEHLFLSLGDAFDSKAAQDPSVLAGKILRMNLDGSVPESNPFPGSLVWSYGHRNPQGLVMAGNGRFYSSEHGYMADDELNLIEPGRNYGHPQVHGFCDLPKEVPYCGDGGTIDPLMIWTPTYAVSGIAWYDHADIPEWRNSLLVVSLKNPRAAEGKRLQVVRLNPAGDQVVEVKDYFINTFGRLREVLVAPDGRVFLFTSNREHNTHKPIIPRIGDDKLIMLRARKSAEQ